MAKCCSDSVCEDVNDASALNSPYQDRLRLWALRILCRLDGLRKLKLAFYLDANELADFLGISTEDVESAEDALVPETLRESLRQAESGPPSVRGVLDENLDLLADMLNLSKVERDILNFVVLLHSNGFLEEITDTLGKRLDLSGAVRVLSVVLDHPCCAVEATLCGGTLSSSGMMRIRPEQTSLEGKFNLLRGLMDALSVSQPDPLALFARFFSRSPDAVLEAEDFIECRQDYALLTRYMGTVAKTGHVGVNVLVYGPPGVGKTQLVRTVCNELGLTLYQVSDQSKNGEPHPPETRFSGYQLSQRVLSRQNGCAVLFDEIEDIFPEINQFFFYDNQSIQRRKAWINRVLETNPVPAFWVANHVQQIDPAYLRRFDMVIELREPGRQTRRRLLARQLAAQPVESSRWLDRAIENPHITPGLIEKAAKVISNAGVQDADEAEKTFVHLTGNVLKAMGTPTSSGVSGSAHFAYRIDLLNAEIDPDRVISGLKRNGGGRVLFFGPPGTGKTRLADYLAEALEMPLLTCKASDVLGKYVGTTEQNLAAVFRKAESMGAVLLLDEIDSLLRTRESAERSWEITQVNELLVQMEQFSGVFIACTNQMETLDPAAIRRFDLKIRFCCLESPQAWGLFQQILEDHGCPIGPEADLVKHRLARLDQLTPGDFNAVVRKLLITGEAMSGLVLIKVLEAECSAKARNRGRSIGFTASI